MSYAFGALADGRRGNSGFVSAEDAQEISVEDARKEFEAVIDALSVADVDVSNIKFGEGYGYTLNGEEDSTNEFYKFERRAYGRGGRPLPGSYNPDTGQITIYRNAFSSRVSAYRVSQGDLGWIYLNADAGFQAGLFITAHELGHRLHQHPWQSNSNEYQANRYARKLYDRVCDGVTEC